MGNAEEGSMSEEELEAIGEPALHLAAYALEAAGQVDGDLEWKLAWFSGLVVGRLKRLGYEEAVAFDEALMAAQAES